MGFPSTSCCSQLLAAQHRRIFLQPRSRVELLPPIFPSRKYLRRNSFRLTLIQTTKGWAYASLLACRSFALSFTLCRTRQLISLLFNRLRILYPKHPGCILIVPTLGIPPIFLPTFRLRYTRPVAFRSPSPWISVSLRPTPPFSTSKTA